MRALLQYLLICSLLLATTFAQAQGCLEIESIYVDACGPSEGENEMVRFRVFNQVNTVDLFVDWPNNPWLGLCQSATTANKVAALNNTITACGHLQEPTNGILPAGAKVLLITSTDFSTANNSFANLSDTLYVLFQCQGNTSGHFANAGSGARTTIMFFNSAATCGDTVTYMRNLLIGGDGARADFTYNGTDSYHNDGCQAPIIPQVVDAGPDQAGCSNQVFNLAPTLSDGFTNVSWSGGAGAFGPLGTDYSSTYTPAAGESGAISLTISATDCNGNVLSDDLEISLQPGPAPAITSSGPDTICNGTAVTLTASGGTSYAWSGGSTSSQLTVTAAGTYVVSVSTACGTDTASYEIFGAPPPNVLLTASGPTTFCEGNSVDLVASGGDTYAWSTGTNQSTITVSTSGTYSVTVADACNSTTVSQDVTVLPLPVAAIQTNGAICQGQNAVLTGTGGNTFVWWDGSTGTTATTNVPGDYFVVAFNNCGSDSAWATIAEIQAPTAEIQATGPTDFCAGESVSLQAIGAGNYHWSTGNNGPAISVSSSGLVVLEVSNACGSAFDSIEVNVHPIVAAFSPSETYGEPPFEVDFTNESTNSSSWNWNFDAHAAGTDAATSAQENPSFTYTTSGNYTVQLIAQNDFGCLDTALYEPIKVAGITSLWAPAAFTPNKDGKNEVFRFKGSGVVEFSATIFDRWGQPMMQLHDLSEGWDGTMPSGPAPIGIYVYKLTYKLEGQAEATTRIGSITLIR